MNIFELIKDYNNIDVYKVEEITKDIINKCNLVKSVKSSFGGYIHLFKDINNGDVYQVVEYTRSQILETYSISIYKF